jgi:hypothetical protein
MNPAASNTITLYQRQHARRQRAKGLMHLTPAVVLLTGMLGVLRGEEPFSPLIIIELVVGLTYIILLVLELRHLGRGHLHPGRVAWLELAAAGILALEGYHIMHRHHLAEAAGAAHRLHLLPWLYFALATLYASMAFWLPRLVERRHLRLHEAGFEGRVHLLRPRFSFVWSDVASVEPSGAADVEVHLKDGTTKLVSFAKLHNGPAHRDQLIAHARQALGN